MKRKFLSVFLALTMMLSLLPATAMATGQLDAPSISNVGLAPMVDRGEDGQQSIALDDYAKIKTDGSSTIILGGYAPLHYNGEKGQGHWVGFYVTAPEGATGFNYYKSSTEIGTSLSMTTVNTLEESVDGESASGFTCYFNVAEEYGTYYVALQWTAEDNSDYTDSTITIFTVNVETKACFSVSGLVTKGDTDAAVSNLVVNLYNADDSEGADYSKVTAIDTATTNENGEFTFTKVPANAENETYVAVVAAKENSYAESKSNSFTVSNANVTGADITLAAEPVKIKDFTLDTATCTYNGEEQTPTLIVTLSNNQIVTDFAGYDVSYAVESDASDNTNAALGTNGKPLNAGTYVVTVTNKSDSSDSKTAEFTIAAKSITNTMVSIAESNYTYTGSEIKPTVTVKDGETTLAEGTDYTVEYSNNTNAAESTDTNPPTVTITGKGNYTGSTTKKFTIGKANITDELTASVVVSTAASSSSSVDLSAIVVKYLAGSETLEYTLPDGTSSTTAGSTLAFDTTTTSKLMVTNGSEISGVPEAETVDVTVSGFTNYNKATITVTITYTDKTVVKLDGVTVTGKTYDGTAIAANVDSLSIKEGTTDKTSDLSSFVVYTWSTSDGTAPKDAGDYTLTVSLKDEASVTDGTTITSYAATPLVISFKISPFTISSNTVSVDNISDQTYTGSAITPEPTVSVTLKQGEEATTLTKGIDYTLSYADNIKVGTATITVTGKGNYTGMYSATFTIVSAPIDATALNATVTAPVAGATPVYTGTTTGTGYTVKQVDWEVDENPSSEISSFVAGTKYRATVGLVPLDGYAFDSNAEYTGTVNGNTATVTNAVSYQNCVFLIYVFTATEASTPSTEPEPETPVEEETPEVTEPEEDSGVEAVVTAEAVVETAEGAEFDSDAVDADTAVEAAATVKPADTSLNTVAAEDTELYLTDTEKESAVEALNDLPGVSGATVDTVSFVTQTYMTVTVNGSSVDPSGKITLSMDITPMARTVVTTVIVDVDDSSTFNDIKVKGDSGVSGNANAVIVSGKDKELTVPSGTKVTVSVELPVDIFGPRAYVGHNGYEYIARKGTDTSVFTFVNPHGFSPFDFSTDPSSAAWIGDVGYESLNAALSEVQNGETIVVTDGSTVGSATRTDLNGKTFYIVSAESPDAGTTPWTGALTINGKTQTVDSDDGKVTVSTSSPTSSGGGSSHSGGIINGTVSSAYSVSVESTTGGTIGLSTIRAAKGDTVTVKINPKTGYKLSDLTVTSSNGSTVDVTKVDERTYTFIMPSGTVKVTPTFVVDSESGETPDETPRSGFKDVPDTSPFSYAVAWAVENGITEGYDDGTFGPKVTCTHNHILTFLWRSQGSPDAEGETDFEKALAWAIENGIADADVDGEASCTRADAVTYMWRLAGSPETEGASFLDVDDDAEYADAVAWALSNNITTGVTPDYFEPDTICNRGQIVTFLYRAYA